MVGTTGTLSILRIKTRSSGFMKKKNKQKQNMTRQLQERLAGSVDLRRGGTDAGGTMDSMLACRLGPRA